MLRDHEVGGRPEELALSLHAAAASLRAAPAVAGTAAAAEVRRLARELGLGAFADTAEALKPELQKIVLALHPDKSGGEFACDADKARFMKARRAIELLTGDHAADAPGAAAPLAGAPQALTDASAPAAAPDDEHRLLVVLLGDARRRIARYFAAPRMASSVLAAALLLLVFTADAFAGHALLGPLFRQAAVLAVLAVLGLAAGAVGVGLWLCERVAVKHAERLLSESALGELFSQARRCARRQGRTGQLSGFDLRRGIDALADGADAHGVSRARRLLGRSLDATTRESITWIQTRRLLARRVIRPVDRPALEVLYEVSPRAMAEAFG